jgi:outer membrane protein assembly factor BamE (lipoprotein component of BamABCDE complex)
MDFVSRRAWILNLALLSIAACATNAQFGSSPRLDRLATLKRGESTDADVLLALGEPRGRGMARLSARTGPRRVWLYEFRKEQKEIEQQSLLLVFLNGERFDGYLWFSSKELLDARQ